MEIPERGRKRRRLHLELLEQRKLFAAVDGVIEFIEDSTQLYQRSVSPSDFGAPIIALYKDYFDGGAFTNISATGGLAPNGLDGNDPDAAFGRSSFRMTTVASHGYFEFGLAKTNNSPRRIAEYGHVYALRFSAKGESNGQSLVTKVLRKVGNGFEFFVAETKQLTTEWNELVVDLPASPQLKPSDIFAVQFQLPSPGTVRLDEVRLNTDGTDPLQLAQSYLPGGWAASGRDATVYPNRAFLYDVALVAKFEFATGAEEMQSRAMDQIDAILATREDGSRGYFNENHSGYVLLADNTPRLPVSQKQTVGDNAWLGLALLDAYRLTQDSEYLTRAQELSDWFDSALRADGPLKGYFGGFDESGVPVAWRSTEHAVDVFEFNRQIAELLTLSGDSDSAAVFKERVDHAATFVISMFDPIDGKLWTGTSTGDTINTNSVPLDSQLWPSLTLALSADYGSVIDWSLLLRYAESNLSETDGDIVGFTFSTGSTPNKVWAEGVAQGITIYDVLGDAEKKQAGLRQLEKLLGSRGGVLAVSSGTMEDPDLQSVYDSRQAVAPSVWAYFASRGGNPFASTIVANRVPVSIELIPDPLPENSVGAIAGTLVVNDPDLNDSHVLESGDTRFEIVDNQLKLKPGVSVDFEAEPTIDIVVTATDDGGLGLAQTVRVNVVDVNEAPTLIHIQDQTADEVSELSFTVVATDPDLPVNALTFSLADAPVGANIDPFTGLFRWSPNQNQGPGSYTVIVRVTDNGVGNLSDSQAVGIRVIDDLPWQNSVLRTDVNGDEKVTALDALLVINQLRRISDAHGADMLPPTRPAGARHYDVSGDSRISSLDALQVINEIGRRRLMSESVASVVGDLAAQTAASGIGQEGIGNRADEASSAGLDDTTLRLLAEDARLDGSP